MEPFNLSTAQVYVNHPEYLQPTPPSETKHRQKVDQTPKKSDVTKSTGDSQPDDLRTENYHQTHSLKTTKPKRREWFIDDVVER